jgi:hypothetical protein
MPDEAIEAADTAALDAAACRMLRRPPPPPS